MIILIWSAVSIVLFITIAGIAWYLLHHPHIKEGFKVMKAGFKAGLFNSGMSSSKKNLTVELWKWETMHDGDVCEDCLERSTWPAMDIADWMKEGMPRTNEAETKCGENCRCQLVRYYPGVSSKKYFNKS